MIDAPPLQRVAIVGGGCGGVAAAFWLSSSAALRSRFHVTLYTHGWRLGGKGASGRNPEIHQRIEEHGLHLWMGCYRRAFQLMREALAADPQPSPTPTVEDAFKPVLELTLQEREASSWKPWPFRFTPRDGYPDELAPYALSGLVMNFADVAQAYIAKQLPDVLSAELRSALDKLRKAGEGLVPGAALQAAEALEGLNQAISAALSSARVVNSPFRRGLILANLAVAFGAGLARDILAAPNPEGAFERLDAQKDFANWLGDHGALDITARSAPVRALYELAFAFPKGDTDRGALAAGAAIGLALRMMDYRGAPFFRLNGGMGDVVFAPLYRVLVERGVEIRFFHRLTEVTARDGAIEEIAFRRQADLVGKAYQPFLRDNGADWWPNQPNWSQLVDGEVLDARCVDFERDDCDVHVGEMRLRHGAPDGFDALVLAVPPEVLKATTARLTQPAWTGMLAHSDSVATQALQIWARGATPSLGWSSGMVMSTFAAPFATWADMSHVLRWEGWPARRKPASVHYFCGPLADGGDIVAAEEEAARWTSGPLDDIWNGTPANLTVSTYVRANTRGSERYVLALPGKIAHRLPPDQTPYANLTLAGDWTRMRFSGGCVENAVESGLIAARRVSGDASLGGA
ncbi:FAD-dependent oxidoreductase [Caulobacter segnis]|uniref:FAD-dependent oxidoreductase n=1 Tax=Caulobacter segnis TaxID=88688 RepID=UPI002864299E|nr:FAD-dependent oxidoreductase [Caulobacter segnis]MDR6624316.1 uncharacterized protein with NAD-binding domain and iron-sulfur cluster [Caulobacter segnis]